MKRFRITYTSEEAAGLVAFVEAATSGAAYLAFFRSHPATNVTSIEEVS